MNQDSDTTSDSLKPFIEGDGAGVADDVDFEGLLPIDRGADEADIRVIAAQREIGINAEQGQQEGNHVVHGKRIMLLSILNELYRMRGIDNRFF